MPHEIDIAIGNRVRTLRQFRRYSQADLGNKIGVQFQQVQKYETGANRISCSRIWLISRALDEPVSNFFEALIQDGPSKIEHGEVSLYSHLEKPETTQMFREFIKLSMPKQKVIVGMIKSMAE